MDSHDKKVSSRARKLGITIGGGTLLVLGILAIPYPGPGWLIVFAALGILAQEYPWARRLLGFAKKQYDSWNEWVKKQGWFVRSLTLIATLAVVILTLWLLNAYGIIAGWFGIDWQWLQSPLPVFN